jgi:uncharacterized protein YndB with AHSA1/START domain
MSQKITVSTSINAPMEKVWSAWTTPADIMQWCHASEDWTVTHAENDPRTSGAFSTGMAAKDGSFSFDFAGTYSLVVPQEKIEYAMGDGREVSIAFQSQGEQTMVTETFDMETTNSEEKQRLGWQAILDNFKKHVEQSAG